MIFEVDNCQKFYCFYKITSSKNYNAGKDKKKIILLIKTYLPNLTMAFLNGPIKTYIWKSGDRHVACLQLVYLRHTRHTTMFTYSRASTPVGQSERAYYLSL